MIKKLLIANRGEIACRIIGTAKKMNIETVAVYSEADTNSLHVRLADRAIYIGHPSATLSYLNQKNMLNAIKISGADAVHPGYGFLSENPNFAMLLEKNNINFVGPSSDAIRKMGDKIQAKKIAQEVKVNIIPGYIGAIKSEKTALKIASKIGYPIMLKAVAGGGGKGIRIVESSNEMKFAFNSAKNEAKSSFADERTFMEKYIESPRHIEIQIIGDKYGNYVCLGERECSIQRRHQKVIEEAPSAFISDKTRKKMYAQSLALAKAVKYHSAGTVEFIVDKKQQFYFLEMNTRLQVEHCVTELVTGYDIVELMIKIAQGEKLPFNQNDVKVKGWAMESRIYAEDPLAGFIPSTGKITTYQEPARQDSRNGKNDKIVRIDTGVYEGGEVSMFYDAMIAKLCTHAPTRNECIELMKDSLGSYIIRGVTHNISFLQAILSSQRFVNGDISTKFIDEEYKDGFTVAQLGNEESAVMLNAAVFIFLTYMKRALTIDNQMNQKRGIGTRWVVFLEDRKYPVTVRPIDSGYKVSFEERRFYMTSNWILGSKLFQCIINGKSYNLQTEFNGVSLSLTFMSSTIKAMFFTPRAAELNKFMKKNVKQDQTNELCCNISGMVTEIKVQKGDSVVKGQPLVTLEAMKMENILFSHADGIVTEVFVKQGQTVITGEVLLKL